MPPTANPIMKHITKFQEKSGIAPQIDVAMKAMPAYRIEARRPIRSPNQPQRNDPRTVPVIPESATYATGMLPPGLSGDFNPYSIDMPGITNASAVGFMMSMMTASAIASSSPT